MRMIANRLRAEFPDRTMAFASAVYTHANTGGTTYDLNIYYWDNSEHCQIIRCRSLDEGIAHVHAILDGADIEQQVPTDMLSVAEVVA